jgi:hypothetical protein
MRTEPLTINGLAGPVVLESGFWANRYTITVGGRPALRTGRGRYSLPTANGGMVPAQLRGGFLDAYPSLEINGVKHRTGPPTPVMLRVLALVPLVLVSGGMVGGLIGALGLMLNMAVARLSVSAVLKALMMLGILVVAVVTWSVAATGIKLAIDAAVTG